MNPSKLFQTTATDVINDGEPSETPARSIAMAQKVPQRVMVRNTSEGTTVYLAHDPQSLQTYPVGNDTWELPPGERDVFVLAPGQRLYVAAQGASVRVSVAVSDLFPVDPTNE